MESTITNDDQLQECIVNIKASHEAVEFHQTAVGKHGKESITAALKCGQYFLQAEKLVKGHEGWIKWCNKHFPNISYKTLSRYADLYTNWTDVSKKDREGCETLNQAYLICKVTPQPKTKKPKTPKGNSNSKGGDAPNPKDDNPPTEQRFDPDNVLTWRWGNYSLEDVVRIVVSTLTDSVESNRKQAMGIVKPIIDAYNSQTPTKKPHKKTIGKRVLDTMAKSKVSLPINKDEAVLTE